jgi:integrase
MAKHRTGHIYRQKKPNGTLGNYYLQYRIDGKLYKRSLGTTSKRDAKREADKHLEGLKLADEIEALSVIQTRIERKQDKLDSLNKADALLLTDTWQAFVASGNRNEVSASTLKIYQYTWNAFLRFMQEKHSDVKYMNSVTYKIAEEYKERFSKKTGRTWNAHRALLLMVWNILKDKAQATENPWERLKIRRESPQGRRALTVKEIQALLEKATGEMKLNIAFGLYLGARLGDACRMEWSMVDVTSNRITYTPHKTARKKHNTLVLPIHPALRDMLVKTPKTDREGFITPDLEALYTDKGPYAVSKQVQQIFTDCGIVTQREGTGVRRSVEAGFHSLRHSAVSFMRAAGTAQTTSQAVVGHSSAEVHNLYTHVDENALESAIFAIPSPLQNANDEKDPVEQILELLLGKKKSISRKGLKMALRENFADLKTTVF